MQVHHHRVLDMAKKLSHRLLIIIITYLLVKLQEVVHIQDLVDLDRVTLLVARSFLRMHARVTKPVLQCQMRYLLKLMRRLSLHLEVIYYHRMSQISKELRSSGLEDRDLSAVTVHLQLIKSREEIIAQQLLRNFDC